MENTEVRGNEVVLDELLVVSSAPHIRTDLTVQRVMLDVIIAMAPAILAAGYFFGIRSLITIAASVIGAVVAEALIQRALKQEVTIRDLSAVVTGILVAFNVPVSMPIWMVVLGSVFAIIVVKQFFGGLGSNFMNPALAARAVLMASWGKEMSNFTAPLTDMVSQATPLSGGPMPAVMDLFIGNMPGTIGEVSKLALLIGAAYLVYRQVISLRIPLVYIGSTVVFLLLTGTPANQILNQVLSGGLILGAFFMATDYVTCPITKKGQIVFGVGLGLLTAIIRNFGGYPEGVSYAILIMNMCVPLIEKFTSDKPFGVGGVKE